MRAHRRSTDRRRGLRLALRAAQWSAQWSGQWGGQWSALWLALWSVALVASASPAGAAERPDKERYPKMFRVRVVRKPLTYLRLYELPRGIQAVEAPRSVTAKITLHPKLKKKDLVFVDVDGNGSFGDVGIDGWTVNSPSFYAYVVPLEERFTVDRTRVRVQFSGDGKLLYYGCEDPVLPEVPAGADKVAQSNWIRSRHMIVETLVNWNRLRLRNGLVPIHLDKDLTYGAIMHARYMAKWRISHREDPSKAEFTKEGDRIGKNASVGPGPALREVRLAYQTFYHRLMLFHPYTRGVGIGDAIGDATGAPVAMGVARRTAVLDGISQRKERRWTWPVIVPAPGNMHAPRAFTEETPVPHPDVFTDKERLAKAGCPITLTFETGRISDVVAELRVDGPAGANVSFQLSWPEKPANASRRTNFKSICLIPDRVLRPKTTYWVKVSYKHKRRAGERVFRFGTAAK